MKQVIQLNFKTREELREWFEKNIESENPTESFDMVFYKKHTGVECIEYEDALEEALCFGWIDGMIKRIDEEKYKRRFAKRSVKSRWSVLNIRKMEKMMKLGLAQEIGIKIFEEAKENGLWVDEGSKLEFLPVPLELTERLKNYPKAEQFFNKLTDKEIEAYSHFIGDAKKEETKKRRLEQAVEKLEKGWRMPYFQPKK